MEPRHIHLPVPSVQGQHPDNRRQRYLSRVSSIVRQVIHLVRRGAQMLADWGRYGMVSFDTPVVGPLCVEEHKPGQRPHYHRVTPGAPTPEDAEFLSFEGDPD